MEKIFLTKESDGSNKERTLTTSSLISFIFAFIVVELYFISPVYFIFKYKKRYIELKHIPFLQIFLNLLNCSTYVVIALLGDGDFQNLITNSIGVTLCLIVIFQLWSSLSKKKNSSYIFFFFFIFNIIFQIYYFIFKFKKEISTYITIIINICMYLSLNIGSYYAFKENKPDRIPILSAILGLLSSIGWTTYSACLEEGIDSITLFSNSFSIFVLALVIAFYIYLLYCRSNSQSIVIEKNEKDINSNKNKDDEMGKDLENKVEDIEDNNDQE